MEEYEMDESEFHGNVPESGAIFMANIETLNVCFKHKVFGLPSVLANFVKQIKDGMTLFLFEYENRRLFGVYKATSDGAINIIPNAFSSIGKQFPAQVRFTPVSTCPPLSESEFKGAISENYYSLKKFKFGLSKDQVRMLLQLFILRQKNLLPIKQLNEDFYQLPKKGRERAGVDRSSPNEMIEMNHGPEDSVFGQDFTDRVTDGSKIKNRKNSERSESELYPSYDRLLESRSEIQDLYFDDERIQPNSLTFFRGENPYSKINVFSSPDSAVAPRFTRESSDFRKRAEHDYCIDGENRTVTEARRSPLEVMRRSEPDLDPFLLDRMYGVDTNDDSYNGYLVRERGNNRNDKVLMSENVLGSNHKDNHNRLGSFYEKLGTLINGEQQRRINEQRFSSLDEQIKTSYLNLPSVENQAIDDYGFNQRTSSINDLDIGNITRASISPKYNALSQLNHNPSEGFNTSFPVYNRNHHSYDSVIHDDIIRKSIPHPPSLHHGRSSPMVIGQSARDTNPYSDYRAFSRTRTCEDDGFIIRSHISDYKDYAPIENPDSINFRSASDAEHRGVMFSPPLNNRYVSDSNPYGVSPKYLSCQMHEEKIRTSCEIQSPRANLTDLNLRNPEYNAVNDELAFYNNAYSPAPHMKTDNRGGYNSLECGNQRKSVFARLTSTSTSRIPKDIDTDIDSSVDELMEILRQGEKFRLKKLKKKKPVVVVQQLVVEGEKKKKSKMITSTSPDNYCHGNSDYLIEKLLTEESNTVVDGIVQETLTETRAVEFRRRRENDKSTENAEPPKIQLEDDKKTKRRKLVRPEESNTIVDGIVRETLTETRAVEFRRRRENADEPPKIQLEDDNKKTKRRKLVRPVFAVNNDIGGINSANDASNGTHA